MSERSFQSQVVSAQNVLHGGGRQVASPSTGCAANCPMMNDRDSVRPEYASELLGITFDFRTINVHKYVEAPYRVDRMIRHVRQVAPRSDRESRAGTAAEALPAMVDACG